MEQLLSIPTLVESKSGSWYLEYRVLVGNQQKRVRLQSGVKFNLPSPNFKAKSEKRSYFEKLKNLVIEHYKTEQSQLRLSAALDEVLEMAKNQRKTKNSYNQIKLPAARFLAYHGDCALTKVAKPDIFRFLLQIKGSNRTRNYYQGGLHWIFERFTELGYIETNCVVGIKKLQENVKRNVAYTDEELQLVLAKCKEYSTNLHLAACLMYSAFLRPGECVQLKRHMIDFDRRLISIPAKIRKTNYNFDIPITNKINDLLHELGVHHLKRNDFVFYTETPDNPLSEDYFTKAFQRVKNRLLDENKILKDQTLYSIRHTSAVRYFMKTNNLEQLKKMLGHQNLKTTLIYLRSLGRYNNDINADDIPDF